MDALPPLPRHVFAHRRCVASVPIHGAGAARRQDRRSPWAGATHRRSAATARISSRGGLSGLGLAVARWLAERGAGRLVLVGRRGVTARSGAACWTDSARAAPSSSPSRSMSATRRALASAAREDSARRSAAARRRPQRRRARRRAGCCSRTRRDSRACSRRRCTGRYLLDALTRVDPLDYLRAVLVGRRRCSARPGSPITRPPTPYLDALAHERAAAWPARPEHQLGRLERHRRGGRSRHHRAARGAGTGRIRSPAQGLAALRAAAAAREQPQVAVCRSTGTAMSRSAARRAASPFFARCRQAGRRPTAAAAAAPSRRRRRRSASRSLRDAPDGAPARDACRRSCARSALRALGLDASRAVDPRTPLGELGLDSLLAVELAQHARSCARAGRCRRRCCSTIRRSTR